MDRNTMPLPRIPQLSLPSFRELDESIESYEKNHPRSRVIHNVYEGRGNSGSPSPHMVSTLPGPYPPYPARGWDIPPDPSQNAFREQGFTCPSTYVEVPRSQLNIALNRDIPVPTSEPLPLRPRQSDTSPTTTQSSLSSAQRILRERMSSSSQLSSPSEVPPNPPRPALGDRSLPQPPAPVRKSTDDPAPSDRAQRRRIGVSFSEVAAHTAKCDECNKRNRNGMTRCQTCGWQLCRKCQIERNGDRTHGSIGASHVPEEGYTPLSPSGQSSESRHPVPADDVRAAQTLLELRSFGNRSPSFAGSVRENWGRRERTPSGLVEQQVDAFLTDSEVTLSIGEDEEWLQGGDDDIPIGEDGLPIGYVITRRNPARAARPTKMRE